jgi:hypothetical protein
VHETDERSTCSWKNWISFPSPDCALRRLFSRTSITFRQRRWRFVGNAKFAQLSDILQMSRIAENPLSMGLGEDLQIDACRARSRCIRRFANLLPTPWIEGSQQSATSVRYHLYAAYHHKDELCVVALDDRKSAPLFLRSFTQGNANCKSSPNPMDRGFSAIRDICKISLSWANFALPCVRSSPS